MTKRVLLCRLRNRSTDLPVCMGSQPFGQQGDIDVVDGLKAAEEQLSRWLMEQRQLDYPFLGDGRNGDRTVEDRHT